MSFMMTKHTFVFGVTHDVVFRGAHIRLCMDIEMF
jgi:hypothetical protein